MQNNFTKATWLHNTNIYEVNLRQYTPEGTINAFLPHLPRLKKMGVHTLWFMPITPIAQKNKKGTLGSYYACASYTNVAPEFGTLTDFKNLVHQAHQMGFKVIIDWVANHTGWDHEWTTTNPDYYEIDTTTHTFKACNGMDDIIELDFNNPNLRQAMIDAMLFWLRECNIDGFRCDLAFWVPLDFWLQARTAIDAQYQNLFWLAECDATSDSAYFAAFDACYSWKWMHESTELINGNKDVPQVVEEILKPLAQICGNQHLPLWFTTNHDENSWVGTEFEKYGNHAKAMAVFSFTWNGLAMLYSGQELPNTKRLQFFDKDVIPWKNEYQYADFYAELLQLKANNKALHAPNAQVQTHILQQPNNRVLAYVRVHPQTQVLVVLNFSNQPQQVQLPTNILTGFYKDVFSNTVVDVTDNLQLEACGYICAVN
jgi:alpha-amylase